MYPNLISALQGMSKALELVQAVTLENARAISRKRTFFYDPRKHLKPITNLDIGTHQAYLENDAKVYFLVGQLVPPKEIEWELHASLWHLMSDLYGANGYINNAESLLNKPLNNQFFSRMLTTFFVRSCSLKLCSTCFTLMSEIIFLPDQWTEIRTRRAWLGKFVAWPMRRSARKSKMLRARYPTNARLTP